MGTAVDVGDAGDTLSQARQETAAALKADGVATPTDISGQPIPKPAKGITIPHPTGPAPRPKHAGPIGPPTDTLAQDQGADNNPANATPNFLEAPKAPDAAPAPKPGVWDQTGTEVGNGIMRGFAELGRAAALVGSVVPVAADGVKSIFTRDANEHDAQDAYFEAMDQHLQSAVDYWKPENPEKSGLGAQVAGDVAGIVPALMTGPLALPALTAKAGADTGIESVRDGQDAKTAALLATTAMAANALGMKIPLKNPSIWKRIASSVGGNMILTPASQVLSKEILKSQGFQEAAAKIDPTDPRTLINTLLTAVGFGLFRQGGHTPKQADAAVENGAKVGDPPSPEPKDTVAPPVPEGTEAPPPDPADTVAPGPAQPKPADTVAPPTPPAAPAPVSPVADKPTPEPASDLRAQFNDMRDPKTARSGVMLSHDNLAVLAGSKDANAAAVTNQLGQATKQNRVVDVPTGKLVMKSAAAAVQAQARLANGEDPQTVIGHATGAGDGKQPDQTAVVQGQTPTGAVATETMVHPGDVPVAVNAAQAEGKIPVVTTPEAAQARRMEGVSKERNAPTQMGIMTDPSGKDRAVHVESGAPEGKLRVRLIGDDGEPSDKHYDVDPSRVKKTGTSMEETKGGVVDAATEAPKPEVAPKVESKVDTVPVTDEAVKAPEPGVVETKPEPAKVEEAPADLNSAAREDTSQPKPAEKSDQTREEWKAAERARRAAMSPEEWKAEQLDRSMRSVYGKDFTPDEIRAEANKTPDGPVKEATLRYARELEGATQPEPAKVEVAPKVLKAKRPTSALETLPQSLETHEAQEATTATRGPEALQERQANAADFGTVLKAAADAARGKASVTDIERATKAAKAAERFSDKGKADTEKNRGTSHKLVDAIVDEMHKSARALLGTAREGDEVSERPKEAILKKKVAKATEAVSKDRLDDERRIRELFDRADTFDDPSPEDSRQVDAVVKSVLGDHWNDKVKWDEEEGYGASRAAAIKALEAKYAAVKPLDAVKAKAKANTEAKKAAAKKAPVKEEPKVEVPVGEKFKDQVKREPAAKTSDEVQTQRTADRLREKYKWADNGDDEKAARAELEDFLHKQGANPDHVDQILQLLQEERIKENPDAVRPTKMSDTLTKEDMGMDETDIDKESYQRGGRELLSVVDDATGSKADALKSKIAGERLDKEWSDLAEGAKPLLSHLATLVDTGKHIGTHDLLNRLIGHTKTPVLRTILEHLRENVPDLPVFMQSKIKSLVDGRSMNGAAGLFAQKSGTIQGSFTHSPAFTLRTLIHEMRHGAVEYELKDNPHGELATASKEAHRILVKRLMARYGDKVIADHMAFFDGTGPKPEGYMRHLYGMKDMSEMHAELDNPKFLREVAESEKFAQPGENIDTTRFNPKGSLLGKIYDAIGKFFGVADPKLLKHIATLHDETQIRQNSESFGGRHAHLSERDAADRARDVGTTLAERFGTNILEQKKAVPELMSLREEPPKLRGVDKEMRSLVDDETTKVARLFKQAINSKAVDAVRTIVSRLSRMDQILKAHRADFGHPDDNNNPMNKYEDVDGTKTQIQQRLHDITRPVAEKWMNLPSDENIKLGKLLVDVTQWGIDPRKALPPTDENGKLENGKKLKADFVARHTEYTARLKALSPEARDVFNGALEANRRLGKEFRRAGIDAALHSFTDDDLSPAQRALLYGAKSADAYTDLIGKGKLIDVGDRNESLRKSLESFAGMSELDGPYMHLGRTGDYVVQAKPEGTKTFRTADDAKAFVDQVKKLSPNSKAKYAELGGEHKVDYKIDYVSMHGSRNEAEAEVARLRGMGYDVGNYTRKTMGEQGAPMGSAHQELYSEAVRKLNKGTADMTDEELKGHVALTDSLRQAFLQMTANRSASASSRLLRKNFAGVKPEEMRKNFADHSSSTIWHIANMRTVFDRAEALGKLRGMARESEGVPQKTTLRRGEAVAAINDHIADDVQSFGHKSAFNSGIAKLGFMSFLASPSHAFIWMTQNFSTGIPVAGAKWGYFKSANSFRAAMQLVTGPSFRSTIHAAMSKGTASDVHSALMEAVKNDKRFGKWAQGANSPMQQLVDRGVINHGYAEALSDLSRKGGMPSLDRTFEYARLLPNMADAWNRVSTALVGLEMTGGDLRKTSDFVREIHADYSQANKPLYFKQLSRVPAGNSLTMFKTYTQSMAHLLYGNVKASFGGDRKFEAAKTVAGMMVGNALFAGVYAGVALEPIRLALYAYHKLFDDESASYDLKDTMHQWLVEHMGKGAGNLASYGLPHAAGFDLSSRMGLSDLFFHEMPDLLSSSKDNWKNFVYGESGTMTSLLAGNVTGFVGHMQRGEPFQAMSSIIPIKVWQDAVKAHELWTTGKINSLGEQMTPPSAGDAAWQLFGLKPADVAEAEEKARIHGEHAAAVKDSRTSILKDFVKGDGADSSRLEKFNDLHPANAIKAGDVKSLMKARAMEEQGLNKDPDMDASDEAFN
jgi:hypothetical protein